MLLNSRSVTAAATSCFAISTKNRQTIDRYWSDLSRLRASRVATLEVIALVQPVTWTHSAFCASIS